jgi:hypothetical protein
MAQIDLRYATIRLKDGFSGTGKSNEAAMAGVTDLDVDTLAGFPDSGTVVPKGARFYANAHPTDIYTVTDHTESMSTTVNVTFSPALANAISDGDDITFLPAQVEINIGEGNLTWTEKREINYKLNRGVLNTVVQGDDQPMEVNTEFLYEFYTSNADGFNPTPVDFIKRTGAASELASSSSDPCEMFSVDMEVEYIPPCGSQDPEIVTFPDFRYEQIEADLKNGTFSISGKCNAVEPIVERDDS